MISCGLEATAKYSFVEQRSGFAKYRSKFHLYHPLLLLVFLSMHHMWTTGPKHIAIYFICTAAHAFNNLAKESIAVTKQSNCRELSLQVCTFSSQFAFFKIVTSSPIVPCYSSFSSIYIVFILVVSICENNLHFYCILCFCFSPLCFCY